MIKIILFLIFLTACTNIPSKNYRKNANDENAKLEESYGWVDQLSFDKKDEKKYALDKDQFNLSNEEASHSLVKESLIGLSFSRLEDLASKTDDFIARMSVKCYQGKFEESLKIADDIYTQYKNNTSYWNQLGTCYYLQSDFAKAILFYNKSRDLDSTFFPPINNLGVVYIKQGKFQKALAAFRKATEVSAFSSTPNYNLAYLYLRFGSIGKAMPILLGLQKKSPQDIEVNSALATANILKGDYVAAINMYGTFDKETLTRPSIGLNYAVALKFSNRNTDAESAFDNVIVGNSLELKQYAQKVDKFIRK